MAEQEYTNGWKDLTVTKWNELYKTNTAQWPCWVKVSDGLGFKADETLRANGLDPSAIPVVMRNKWSTIGKLLELINETIPITYIEIPV